MSIFDQLTKTSFLKEPRGADQRSALERPVVTRKITWNGLVPFSTTTYKEQGEGKEKLVEEFVGTVKITGPSLLALYINTEMSLVSCLQRFEGGDAIAEIKFWMEHLTEIGMSGKALEDRMEAEEEILLRDLKDPISPIPSWVLAVGYFNDAWNLLFTGMSDVVEYEKNFSQLNGDMREDSWSNLARAYYYCGKAEVFAGLPAILKEKSRIDGATRRKPESERPFSQHKKITLEFLKANKKKHWTKSHAAKEIRDYLNELHAQGKLDRELSDQDGGVETVKGWLSTMSGAAEFFPKKS
ncbi:MULTISPECIES: hypothetical protein [Polaromonas]|uniref:Uncharacterized protein n=1 Tax=Polaromonas aquatica TaxID=332657 RepID=A0ABW1U6X9_9BURK